MNSYSSQKYYLINLSTRTVSITTHLRAENYSLSPGKCVYLGCLTDELVVKYHRYAALNISLRILTQDKVSYVIKKSINSVDETINDSLQQRQSPIANSLTTKVVEQTQENKTNNTIEENLCNPNENLDCNNENQKEDDVIELKNKEEELKEESLNEEKVESIEDLGPREIDVVEESAKYDLKNMTYSQLCDLAKARNIKYKGRVSRNKLIDIIAKDLQ